MKNANCDETKKRRFELLHMFLQLSPKQQQQVIDEIRKIKSI